jgi:hypothetical protein
MEPKFKIGDIVYYIEDWLDSPNEEINIKQEMVRTVGYSYGQFMYATNPNTTISEGLLFKDQQEAIKEMNRRIKDHREKKYGEE